MIGPVNVSIQHLDGRNRVVHTNRLQPHRQRSSFRHQSQYPINEYTTTRYSLTDESGTSCPVIQHNTRSCALELRKRKQKDMDHSERHERNNEDETTNSLNQSIDTSTLDISKSIIENDHTNPRGDYCSPEKHCPHVVKALKLGEIRHV